MKVLLINCVYRKGSTGKIVYDIYSGLLRDGQECTVCYGRGQKTTEPSVYKCCTELYAKWHNLLSRFTGMMYGGATCSTARLCKIICKENPDVVHIHCINGYFVNIYKLITFLKNNHIKTVLTNHAEFFYTANCSHALDCEKWKTGCGNCPRLKRETKSIFLDRTAYSWNKMKNAFCGFDDIVVTSVSPWLQERAQASPILSDKKHVCVYNGVDTSVFRFCSGDAVRRNLELENRKIIFHATASFSSDVHHIKGGCYVIEMAKRFWETDKDVAIVVAGPYSLTEEAPPNMYFLGNLSDQKELAQWYATANVTLLTSKKETFSMIVAESLCCGTPVVGFEAGAPEMIALKEYSSFVPQGNVDMLFATLETYLNTSSPDRESVSKCAHLEYGREKMVSHYMSIYQDLVMNL